MDFSSICSSDHISVTPLQGFGYQVVSYAVLSRMTDVAEPIPATIYVVSNMALRYLAESLFSLKPLSCRDQVLVAGYVAGIAVGGGCLAARMGGKWIARKYFAEEVDVKFSVKDAIKLGIASTITQWALAWARQTK